MADELDSSSSEFSDTSSSFLDSSLESSISESEAEDSGGERADAECKSSDSQRRKTPKAKTNGKSKLASQTKSLNKQQMEELSLWVFSDKEAKNVESELRERLLKSPRVKAFEERWKIALRFTSEEQQENFNILNVGFCRKFATLAKQCYENNLPKDRKAALSVAWMKVLCNFQSGKATQERMILERFLHSSKELSFRPEEIHRVLSVIHELVYTIIHEHIQLRKRDLAGQENLELQFSNESDDTLYRYCGAALQRMIKLRKETLAAKKNRVKLSSKRKPVMERELEILEDLVMKDKSGLSSSLKNLDEGNLTFPREELIPFLRSVDKEVREFSTVNNLRKYQSKFLHMCQNCVINNESLETEFGVVIDTLLNLKSTSDEIVGNIFKELTSKLANTRINEFLNAKSERDLKMQGKVVDADEMLRPKLKLYALASKRKV